MGYGGVFKTVLRVAIPAAVALTGGGAFAIALSSAATTGATGGSFKESLTSFATSYIGASISESINAASAAGTEASFMDMDATFDAIANPLSMSDTINMGLADANKAIEGLASSFSPSGVDLGLGGVIEGTDKLFKTGFDVLQSAGDVLLGKGALTSVTATAPLTPIGGLIGGAATFTLNQALLANTLEADQLLIDEGFSPQQIQLLKQEARNALSQEAFEGLQGTVTNPGLPEEEFNKILAAGIERENVRLGPDITREQFRTVFDDPNLGQSILSSEEALRRQSFGQEIGQAFPGDVFKSIDDDIISSIVQERQGPAQKQISAYGARGNLNPLGGQTANLFIQEQIPEATKRVETVGQGVLGGYQRDIEDIRGRASEQVKGYRLGDEPFDIEPFRAERAGFIGEKEGAVRPDIVTALGGEPIFDVAGALQTAGRAQGVVSGTPSKSLLDTLAARETGFGPSRRNRGLGTRGSGAF